MTSPAGGRLDPDGERQRDGAPASGRDDPDRAVRRRRCRRGSSTSRSMSTGFARATYAPATVRPPPVNRAVQPSGTPVAEVDVRRRSDAMRQLEAAVLPGFVTMDGKVS